MIQNHYRGPLRFIIRRLDTDISILELRITYKIFQINNLNNNFSIDPERKLEDLYYLKRDLFEFRDQIKILRETRIIISCA